jgi:hypothetical protein
VYLPSVNIDFFFDKTTILCAPNPFPPLTRSTTMVCRLAPRKQRKAGFLLMAAKSMGSLSSLSAFLGATLAQQSFEHLI